MRERQGSSEMAINFKEIPGMIRDRYERHESVDDLYEILIEAFFENVGEFQDYMAQLNNEIWEGALYEPRERTKFYGVDEFFYEGDVFYINGIDVEVCNGATKGVLLFSDEEGMLPYVVKFPSIEYNLNFCELEAAVYNNAESEGYEENFAECHYLGKILEKYNADYDLPFYLQEYCEVNSYEITHEATEKIIGSSVRPRSYDDVMNSVESVYGYDYTIVKALIDDSQEFEDFLMANEVTDCHNGNFGFKNGRVVLVDYSGF